MLLKKVQIELISSPTRLNMCMTLLNVYPPQLINAPTSLISSLMSLNDDATSLNDSATLLNDAPRSLINAPRSLIDDATLLNGAPTQLKVDSNLSKCCLSLLKAPHCKKTLSGYSFRQGFLMICKHWCKLLIPVLQSNRFVPALLPIFCCLLYSVLVLFRPIQSFSCTPYLFQIQQ
jgi:hypothetical protein